MYGLLLNGGTVVDPSQAIHEDMDMADISVLDLMEGRWELTDATGVSRTGSRALVPVVTIKGGRVIEPGELPHSRGWGWTPPSAVQMGAAP